MKNKTTHKGAWPGSRDPISKFWDPNNFWTKRAIRFKFGTDVEDGASLRKDHKTTQSGRGRGHVTKFPHFGTPLITFDWIEQSASNLVQRRRTEPACVKKQNDLKWAWPGSRDPISTLWDHPNNFWQKTTPKLSNPLQIWYRHRGRSLPV